MKKIIENISYGLIGKIIVFVGFLFLPLSVIASQPVNGWKSNVEINGEPLTITWKNEQNRLKLVAWMQNSGISQPYIVSQEDDKLTISRRGVNSIPKKLLIVPEDRKLKPMAINVSQETTKIQFNFESIPGNEVWF